MVVLDCLLIEKSYVFIFWRVIIYQYKICYNSGKYVLLSVYFSNE